MMLSIMGFLLFSISSIHADVCPYKYEQAPNNGDCYMLNTYYDLFSGQFFKKTFDEAEIDCNQAGGGLLMSIHNQEEDDVLFSWLGCTNSGGHSNIGLKCKGRDCKWDDGSPITYVNFSDVPPDDNTTRCYGRGFGVTGWVEKGCGKQQNENDCFICRVKARTIDCLEGETEYKGGCVSVHSSPLDQKSAEASCPGAGHLVSIHSVMENELYTKIALDAGINGTIYIGGQYSKAVFYWSDGSYEGYSNWANWFPNLILGTCTQMLLASEFGVQGQWASIDCTAKQPYMCFRDGAVFGPTVEIPGPKADPHCPPIQQFTGNGTIYSPNYPIYIPTKQTCEYIIETEKKTYVYFKFNFYDCQYTSTFEVYEKPDWRNPAYKFDYPPEIDSWYSSNTNHLKIVFATTDSTAPTGKGWEMEFMGG